MHVHTIDHVEFHVGDADDAAAAFRADYGFRVRGGLTGPGSRSVLVTQGAIRVLLTEATDAGHPAAAYVARHGDGLATIALAVDDPDAATAEAVRLGAVVGPGGRMGGFGDVAHTFVRADALLERVEPVDGGADSPLELLETIDHVAVCVPAGELLSTVAHYERVLGFGQVFTEHIQVGSQAMNSIVVQSPNGQVTLTLLEPDTTALPGQIDAFLAAHEGAGVQHLAFGTADIATAVRTLAGRGVRFLSTPGAYYDELERRVGRVAVPVDVLRELNVLVDQDTEGELFQIFAQSTHPRRTLFFELIERLGALTFGSANIKALYEAVERERAAAPTPTATR
ncbi:4-hydroxyphenylpyruvate dioxygenase [Actinokineospora spheciospongiae]|uniref:4-hydroxyphenylpyruvate dioxygenase n=1 Tax=Actinokineospora spheciospongiae TaxID=909613 RepID=UPI000D713BBC|nr:4-hydroxyphenylpyruvate dioxygenase [Actinokineospora spheciospongiae]PWW52670.1 4-hydroxymandelate synthase [Actinokineospora spheciospongiae]